LSYRYVEELLGERGIEVDQVTVYRWVQRFTAEVIDAARPSRHASGDRWFVEETYVKVAGRWTYLFRVVDQFGQVIDVVVSTRRHADAARALFARAARFGAAPVEVSTDRALSSACSLWRAMAGGVVTRGRGRMRCTARRVT
jgi:transposase, IS6 family